MDTPMGLTRESTAEEIKARKRRCSSPPCKHKAFLEDWCGWKWCFYHAYRSWRWGHERTWFYLKTLKLF